jgi:lipopolysaccharide heptosyltransferase II
LSQESCFRLRFLVKFINAGESIGRQNNFGDDFVNLVLPENPGIHEVERMMSVVKKGTPASVPETAFCLPSTFCNSAETGKEINRPYVVLSPGGTKKFRRWPAENFVELSQRFSDIGLETVFVGDTTEREILTGRGMRLPLGVRNLVGKTNLQELCALIKAARIVVANDSGPMHLANALNVPVVGIFGSGDTERTRPYRQEKARVVASAPLACKPCYAKACESPRCMDDITVERVWEAVTDLMK